MTREAREDVVPGVPRPGRCPAHACPTLPCAESQLQTPTKPVPEPGVQRVQPLASHGNVCKHMSVFPCIFQTASVSLCLSYGEPD